MESSNNRSRKRPIEEADEKTEQKKRFKEEKALINPKKRPFEETATAQKKRFREAHRLISPRPFKVRKDPQLKFNSAITVFGKRGTGKSFWIKWFLTNYKDVFPWFYVFTLTKFNRQYASYLNDHFIFDGYKPWVIDQIMSRQKLARRIWEKNPFKYNPRICIILDDIIDQNFIHDSTMKRLYNNGRHYFITIIAASQVMKGYPPFVRKNTDLTILFRLVDKSDRETAYDCFGAGMDRFEFDHFLDQYTEDRGFLAMFNDPNKKIDDRFYFGKAEEIPKPMPLGSKQYWEDQMDQYHKIKSGWYEEIDKAYDKAVTTVGDIEKLIDKGGMKRVSERTEK
jgi:hypothetical protein